MEQLDTVIGEGGALEALLEAKAAGKIGHIGLTAHSTAVFERALNLDWVETIMFPYNIVENQGRRADPQMSGEKCGLYCHEAISRWCN
mgnify:CR=1 FL=1